MSRAFYVSIFFLCAAAINPAIAQAPSTIVGLTLRTSYEPFDPLGTTTFQSIDFYSDGTFTECLSATTDTFAIHAVNYGTPESGTYTYTLSSPTTASLILTPSELVDTEITFTSSSQGYLTLQGSSRTPITLTPTYGVGSQRALVNMSVLIVAQQGSPTSFGFVVGGSLPLREIFIRAVGPSLAPFGITNYAADPTYSLLNAPFQPFSFQGGPHPDAGWSATVGSNAIISAECARAGAFALRPGSTDKADIFLVSPGAYTITVNPTDPSQAGAELIEVYEVQ